MEWFAYAHHKPLHSYLMLREFYLPAIFWADLRWHNSVRLIMQSTWIRTHRSKCLWRIRWYDTMQLPMAMIRMCKLQMSVAHRSKSLVNRLAPEKIYICEWEIKKKIKKIFSWWLKKMRVINHAQAHSLNTKHIHNQTLSIKVDRIFNPHMHIVVHR